MAISYVVVDDYNATHDPDGKSGECHTKCRTLAQARAMVQALIKAKHPKRVEKWIPGGNGEMDGEVESYICIPHSDYPDYSSESVHWGYAIRRVWRPDKLKSPGRKGTWAWKRCRESGIKVGK